MKVNGVSVITEQVTQQCILDPIFDKDDLIESFQVICFVVNKFF